MLVLTRYKKQTVVIGSGPDQVRLTVVDIRGDKVRLAFDAPAHICIDRKEVYDAKERVYRDPSQ